MPKPGSKPATELAPELVNGLASAPVLDSARLAQAWRGQSAWRILDCEFHSCARFFSTLLAWHGDADRPHMLHYVAVAAHWADLQPGFHRYTLAQGQVLLTLCIGKLQTQLREQQFAADAIYLDLWQAQAPGWDSWRFKALARCCRRGTLLALFNVLAEHRTLLQDVGFELDIENKTGLFNPRWEIKTTRRSRAAQQSWHQANTAPSDCIVLGAGLAGASVAAALARRGWQVRVMDAADQPATGASGLPVGLMEPLISAIESPRARLARSGFKLTLEHAKRLLINGQDWAHSGVMDTLNRVWQADAAWIKPATLVGAWLAQAGVAFVGDSSVHSLAYRVGDQNMGNQAAQEGQEAIRTQEHQQSRKKGLWHLYDKNGDLMAASPVLVLACAAHTAELLTQSLDAENTAASNTLPRLQGVPGCLSWGWQTAELDEVLPAHPVNGRGSLIAGIPQGNQKAWYLGATYDTASWADLSHTRDSSPSINHRHIENFERLQTLWPQAANALQPLFSDEPEPTQPLFAWQGVRCVSPDRVPVVGQLQEGLWVSTAMGSRGLTFAALCAELLAAQLMGEPWPVEAKLGKALSPYSNDA